VNSRGKLISADASAGSRFEVATVSISTKTSKMLWGRAAGHCSMCRITLFVSGDETDDDGLIGEMCHIVAESDDGPRGVSPLTPEQRDKYDNLVLMCRNHHGEIDKLEATYPIERLRQIKADHEKWVSDSVSFDAAKQKDDETYAGYVDAWSEGCELKTWTAWSSWVFSAGQPKFSVELDRKLESLRTYLLRRVWPERYPGLESAFHNFRLVLQDFQNVFRQQADLPHPSSDMLFTTKFYKERWDEVRYEKELSRYEEHVDLVQDLMLDLTRAANLLCDRVREAILPSFFPSCRRKAEFFIRPA
jgi:hypothetical protein